MSKRGKHTKGRHLGESSRSTQLRVAHSLLMGALVAFALLVVAIPLATGGEWRTVQTGSMEPAISSGDVVLVTSDNPVEIGDVIAFSDPLQPDRDILHRVVDISDQGLLTTKGDANDVDDPWQISPSEVIGTQSLSIPKIGLLVQTASTDLGIFFFLFLPASFILVNESRVWYRYVRYGPEAFEPLATGRHIAPRGKHLAGPA